MKLKFFLIGSYLLLMSFLFGTFTASSEVWFSFFVSALVVTVIFIYHLFLERAYSPFIAAYLVFTVLFFLVAPMIQIDSFATKTPEFATNFIYKPELAVFANALVILFNSVFFLMYYNLKRLKWSSSAPRLTAKSREVLPLTIVSLVILTLFVFVISIPFILDEYSRPNWQVSSYSIMHLLIYKKVFFLIPFAGLILCVQYFRDYKKLSKNTLIILGCLLFFGVLLFWFKNPLTEKRNALGPIYIGLVFLMLPKLLNTNVKTLSFLFFSMVIAFPVFSILTHTDATFAEILKDPGVVFEEMKHTGLVTTFSSLNYDAFSNMMASIEMIRDQGFAIGYQLLSGLLFFVPRSLWTGKPYGSGQVVGDYLIDTYDFNFNNLSNPLVSEGYINFGILGVILMAIGLAVAIQILSKWLRGSDLLKRLMAFYFAIHLIFLLRGDFANGYSYYIGTLVGVLLIPKTIQFIIKQLFLHQQLWKKLQIKKA